MKSSTYCFALLLFASADLAAGEAAPRICVPEAFRLSAPGWVPDAPTLSKDGIAFTGCWPPPGDAGCPLPAAIVSGGISWSRQIPRTYAAIPADAFYRELSDDPKSTRERPGDGDWMVVSNPARSRTWLVWKVGKASDGILRDADELVASCSPNQVATKTLAGTRNFCHRTLLRDGYSVSYTFDSPSRVPQAVAELDAAVLRVVDSWKCPEGKEDRTGVEAEGRR